MKTLILLIFAALASATMFACSDEKSDPLTVEQYLESLEIVFDETANDTAFLRAPENTEVWLVDLNGTRDLLSQSVPVSEETAGKLDRLTPPDALAVPHSKLVTSFGTILAGNQQVQSALAEMSTNQEMDTFEANELPIPGTPEAARDFREACQALQDYGTQTGTTVNLHCNEL